MTPFFIYFDFMIIPKKFFQNFELPSSGCGLSASAAYPPLYNKLFDLEQQLVHCPITLGFHQCF